MHFLSVRGMIPTQVEASFHQIEGSPMCAFVRFIRVDQCLDLCGQEVADGCGTLGCERLGFLCGLRVKAQSQGLLSYSGHTRSLQLLETYYLSYAQSCGLR
jgi:hypothetical protein